MDAGYREWLAPSGITLEALRTRPEGVRWEGLVTRYEPHRAKGGFATPSRRVEIWSETFRRHGQDPLPGYVPPAVGAERRPDLAARYPLVLSSAKPHLYCHGQHRNLPKLRRRLPDPLVEVHPDTAAARGIADGDWVGIRTPAGQVRRGRGSGRASPRTSSPPSTAGGSTARRSAFPATRPTARGAPTSTSSSTTWSRTPSAGRLRTAPTSARSSRFPSPERRAGAGTARRTSPGGRPLGARASCPRGLGFAARRVLATNRTVRFSWIGCGCSWGLVGERRESVGNSTKEGRRFDELPLDEGGTRVRPKVGVPARLLLQ